MIFCSTAVAIIPGSMQSNQTLQIAILLSVMLPSKPSTSNCNNTMHRSSCYYMIQQTLQTAILQCYSGHHATMHSHQTLQTAILQCYSGHHATMHSHQSLSINALKTTPALRKLN